MSCPCETIYQAYPRHVGKKAALKAIARALKEVDAEWLLTTTREFAASPAGNAGQYTPHCATWMNQGRYYDDQVEWRRGKPIEPGLVRETSHYTDKTAQPMPSREEMLRYIREQRAGVAK